MSANKPDIKKLRKIVDRINRYNPLPWRDVDNKYIVDVNDQYIVDTRDIHEELIVKVVNALPWLLEQAELAEQPKVCARCGCVINGRYVAMTGEDNVYCVYNECNKPK